MQKKIIALAIAGLASTAAFAQSNVTVYGIADAGVGVASGSNGIRSNPLILTGGLSSSRIGFKGVEDLGNGTKALFALEYGVTLDGSNTTGAANTQALGNARQTYVGLTGAYGTVLAGYLQTTGYDWGVKYDVVAGSQMSPLQNLTTNSGLIGATNATAARLGNAIAYVSPKFAGFTAAVNYSSGATNGEQLTQGAAQATTANAMGLYYDNGPLSVGLVRMATVTDVMFNNGAEGRQDLALGASYDFGVAKVTATTQKTAVNKQSPDVTHSVGVAVPVTAVGTVAASFAMNTMESTKAVGADDVNSKGWSVVYLHALSKRTTAYAGYVRTINGANANLGVGNNAAYTQAAADGHVGLAAVGVRHSF